MTISSIKVNDNWFSKSITIDGHSEKFESSASMLQMLNLRTRSLGHGDFPNYLKKIDGLFNLSHDIELVVLGSDGMCSFAVHGDGLADNIAWEALPIRFRSGFSEPRYIPVRIGPASSTSLSSSGGSLRILALVGHPGAARAYNATQIKELVEGVLRTLSPTVLSHVTNPSQITTIDLANDARATWAASMTRCNPQLVLFFGHGEGKPEPRVKTTEKEWLPLDDLFDALVGKGNQIPPFWLLIACSLADHDTEGTATNRSPLSLLTMGTRGALSVVAMRHEVRISTAKLFLSEFFRLFVCGASVEVAAAGGRRVARLSKYGSSRGKWDWAAPAVWSFRDPVHSLSWNPLATTGSTVETALRLLRSMSGDPTLGVDVESVETGGVQATPTGPFIRLAPERVQGWIRERRIKLMASEADGPGHIAQCSAILDVARRQFDRCPLLIRPTPGRYSFGSRLRKWAEDLQTDLIPSHDDPVFVDALRQVAHGDEDGLRALLALPGLFVIFLDAPEVDDLSWELFETAPPDCVIAVCHSDDRPRLPSVSWYRDSFGEEEVSEMLIEEVISTCPRTAAILSVLRQPVRVSELRNLAGEVPSDLLTPPLLRTEPASGVVLADSARHRISSLVGAEALIQAHIDIVEYLFREGRLAFDWDALLLIQHLADAARWKDLAEAVNVYADSEAVNWIGLADALTKARSAFFAIKPRVLLEIARSFIDRQEIPTAHLWLQFIETNSLLEKAWQQTLLSETCKGLPYVGASEEMWQHAREAIRLCEQELAANPTSEHAREALHRNQLQLARLELYFNHSAEVARREFERLIDIWGDAPEPDTRHALAAAKRNLAECLFEFPPFSNDSACRAAAKVHLVEAQQICYEAGFAKLGCDIEYSLAKLSEREGDYSSAIHHLKLCSRDAWDTGYTLVRRIADARLYWTSVRKMAEPFSLASFYAIQRPLEFLEQHAWAARYAIRSRLWAALKVANGGNRSLAVVLLICNLKIYAEHRSLNSATDLKNLSRSCAGLLLLDEDGTAQQVWGDIIRQALQNEQQNYRELFEGGD